MKKIIWIVVLLLLMNIGVYAVAPEKTHVFQSGALIKASELNQNEDDFFNAITDGTKDLTIDDLTADVITATSFKYKTTQTVTKIISFSSFHSVTSNVAYYYNNYLNNGEYLVADTLVAAAPVYFPNGATVTGLMVSGSAGVIVTLNRQVTTSTTVVAMATATATTADASITSSTIDNDGYSYYLVTEADTIGDDLYYVRLNYTLTTFTGAN